MNNPLVTVLMPAYNAGLYIAEAIDSILSQTYTNLEFLIINDGSTDNTVTVIESYNDSRIRLVSNDKNRGLIYSLNRGLELAQGKYIARMDADDITTDIRFETQVRFLEAHSDIDILGTALVYLDTPYEIHHPLVHDDIVIGLIDNSTVAHATIMMRRDTVVVKKLIYEEEYKHIEDYRFWLEAVIKGVRFANIDDVFYHYRTHPEQVCSVNYNFQERTKEPVRLAYLSHFFGNEMTQSELASVHKYKDVDLATKVILLDKLSKINNKNQYFYSKGFDRYMNILIYRNITLDKYIPFGDFIKVLTAGVSFKFISTMLKINLKKLLKK